MSDVIEVRMRRLETEIRNLQEYLQNNHISLGNGDIRHKPKSMMSISNNIKLPSKDGDVGYNLVSNHEAVIPTDDVVNVKTGVKVKLPPGYWGMITARSSAVFKHHILVLPGVIDNGYTGELMVACTALVRQRILSAGTSIAQLLVFPMVTPSIEMVSALPETERGESGFGSTGGM